jgi:uncharacterized membrane protein YccC
MRTALRTGVGLALATLVVEVVGLSHGFWVLLGVIATLRLDGLATVKTSLLALLGTFVGAVVGYGLLTVDMTHPVLLWIGLVLVAFLAVYTQATAAYIVGQAAFSLFVIVAFSISNWPPELAVADERFIDIAYGAAISTAVALLMWPRGVVSDLVSNVSDAIRRASRVLTDAVADFVDGGERVAPSELLESASAFVRSREVIEVTLSSRAPTAIERAHAWQDVIDHLRTLTVTGHLISVWSKDGPPLAAVVPALGAPLTADARTATEAWEHTAEMIDGAVVDECSPEFAFMASVHRAAGDLDLHDVEIANRVVGAVWSHGWISMTYHASISAQPPRVDS